MFGISPFLPPSASLFSSARLSTRETDVAVILDTKLWKRTRFSGSGPWSIGRLLANAIGAARRALVSDFSVVGDFALTATVMPCDKTDGSVGMFLGWQDAANHYRIAMDYADSGARRAGTGVRDVRLSLTRRIGGDSTVLFGVAARSATDCPLTFTVGRSGGFVEMAVHQEMKNIANASVADATYLGGRIGLYSERRTRVPLQTDHPWPDGFDAVPAGDRPDRTYDAVPEAWMFDRAAGRNRAQNLH